MNVGMPTLLPFYFSFLLILPFVVRVFLDFEFAVFDHVVCHSGGNSCIHSIGVSVPSAVCLMFIVLLLLY